MPATVRKNDAVQRTKALTDDLVTLLQYSGKSQSGPLVVMQNRIAQTKSIHVVMIWDAWKDLLPTERSKVILDASIKAKWARGATITVAMGLTSEEALRAEAEALGLVEVLCGHARRDAGHRLRDRGCRG